MPDVTLREIDPVQLLGAPHIGSYMQMGRASDRQIRGSVIFEEYVNSPREVPPTGHLDGHIHAARLSQLVITVQPSWLRHRSR
ncbi:hypothetical protein BN77_3006 [Rhizobium mesoamericanum STM3625]|uniref:Uncharacterized protein n=1 Tax=Rhizobium mesoamericanum STM3625 TaxID=1211777 RepID=K0PWX0_9HYPH|nr:hypothetical protein BN77_3006 [Rhizobium mesoamericanum STM3625]